MPWCPKCGIEYRDGLETCSDCGVELSESPVSAETDSVLETEVESEVESKVETKADSESELRFDKEAFLTSTGSSIEADMLEGLLNAEEIPVLKKYGDGGDYLKIYMGGVTSGVDLYVPLHLLDKAKGILEISKGVLGSEIPEDELEAQALAAQPEDEDPEDVVEGLDDDEAGDDSGGDENAGNDPAENDPAGDGKAIDKGIGDEEPENALPVSEEHTLNAIESQGNEPQDGKPQDGNLPEEAHRTSEPQEQENTDAGTGSFFRRFMHMLTGK